MTAKEIHALIMAEVKEGKTDIQILAKILLLEGYENGEEEIRKIREEMQIKEK